jgi:hypothetical protein
MSRRLLVLGLLVLGFVSTFARAESPTPSKPSAATDAAAAAANIAERRVAQLTNQSTALEKRYNDEVDAIDRLKRQRPSWRRDREIRDSLTSSLETSNRLEAATAELRKAQGRLDMARRAYFAAIDLELAAGPGAPRAQVLERAKAALIVQLNAGAPRPIKIPDLDIDPLADPEELDQHAAELRESEKLLSRQLAGLDAQVAELQRGANLRKHNERAADLVSRYDDAPHRAAVHGSDGNSQIVDAPAPNHLPASGDGTAPYVDSSVPVVINDVVDVGDAGSAGAAGTLRGTGQRTTDLAQRADAVRRARDMLARQLEQVRNKRLEIETRAKVLRGKRP